MEKIETPKTENIDAGIEKIPQVKDFAETWTEKGFVVDEQTKEAPKFRETSENLKKFFGFEGADIVPIFNKEKYFIAVTIPYGESLSAVSIIDTEKYLKRREETPKSSEIQIEDTLFVSTESGKSISLKDSLVTNPTFLLDSTKYKEAYAQKNVKTTFELAESEIPTSEITQEISMPVLGKFTPPPGFIDRGMWNVLKKIEPLVFFHEARHTEQSDDVLEDITKRERDAWYYALRQYRRIRDQGLDLLPELKNSEIVSRLELALQSYEFKNVAEQKGLLDKAYRSLPILKDIAKIAWKDPSLALDTLSYSGSQKLKPVTLKQLLKRKNQ